MRVADVMETRVEAANAEMPAEAAWNHMRRRGLRLYVVVDSANTLGVVTRHQLGGPDGRRNREARVLKDFVESDPAVVTPDAQAAKVARVLDSRRGGFVAVLREGHLVGVLTMTHLLRALVRLEQRRAVRPRGTRRRTVADETSTTPRVW